MFDENYASLLRLAFVFTRDQHDAEELVQEAFLDLQRRWRSVLNPPAYLRAAVVNAARREGRKRTNRKRILDENGPVVGRPLATNDWVDHYLTDALAKLPERHRTAVVLAYYAQLTSIEIGEILGCRPSTARSLVNTGGNWLLALLIGFDRGFSTGLWATYKQWQSLGRQVAKGERGLALVRWVEPKAREHPIDDDTARTNSRRVPIAFTVFAPEQLVADDQASWQTPSTVSSGALGLLADQQDDGLERWISSTGAEIRLSGSQAFYAGGTVDRITVPTLDAWDHWGDYYATVTHELVHWTGHESRLARPRITGEDLSAGALAYEELIAEFGAAMIGQTFGFAPSPRADHAGYLAHWADQIEADAAKLWSAASAAQKAIGSLPAVRA